MVAGEGPTGKGMKVCRARCAAGCAGGRDARYFFLYPNTMVNRYGPWLDVSVVHPGWAQGPRPIQVTNPGSSAQRCTVTTSWFLDAGRARDAAFVEAGLAASEQACASFRFVDKNLNLNLHAMTRSSIMFFCSEPATEARAASVKASDQEQGCTA